MLDLSAHRFDLRSWRDTDERQGDGAGFALVALQEREREHRAAITERLASVVDADDRLCSACDVDSVTHALAEIVLVARQPSMTSSTASPAYAPPATIRTPKGGEPNLSSPISKNAGFSLSRSVSAMSVPTTLVMPASVGADLPARRLSHLSRVPSTPFGDQ